MNDAYNLYDIAAVNKHRGGVGHYIGRGSPLGNPFSIGPQYTRDQAINTYEGYLTDKIRSGDRLICEELNRLGDLAQDGPLRLLCFCAPLRCHGDVIRRVLITALNRRPVS